jgi:protein-disulfide isomerase
MATINKLNKLKWYQKWWGILILLILSFAVIFCAVLIYQVITLLDATAQLKNITQDQNMNQVFATDNNIKDILETKDDPYWGPSEAKIVIVEFSDFQCPYCRQQFPILERIRQEYKDSVKLIYRDFPNLSGHPDALNSAIAAECADDQNMFWPYHDLLFTNQEKLNLADLKQYANDLGLDTDKFNQCLDNKKYYYEVLNDLEDGSRLGASGTPTFFINGNMIAGVQSYETLKQILDQALAVKAKTNN